MVALAGLIGTEPLENQNPVSWWLLSLLESSENFVGALWQQVAEPFAQRRERGTVSARVADEHDQETFRVVPSLQPQSSFERLDVGQARLGLDTSSPVAGRLPTDHGVPRPKILTDWKRDFRGPAKGRIDLPAQSIEQSELGSISDGITGGVGPEAQVPANHGEPGAHIGNHDAREFAALKSPQLGVGRAARHRHVSQAQTSSDPCLAKLDCKAFEGILRAPAPSIRGPLAGSHRATGSQPPMHGALSASDDSCYARRTKEPEDRRSRALSLHSAVDCYGSRTKRSPSARVWPLGPGSPVACYGWRIRRLGVGTSGNGATA